LRTRSAFKYRKIEASTQKQLRQTKKSKLTLEQRNWLQENDYYWPENAPAAFFKDRNFALEFCKENGSALQYVDLTLRGDEEIVHAAVQNRGGALEYADFPVRKKREVILSAVTQNGDALSFAHELLRDDPEVVQAAVASRGTALEYASERLRNDVSIVTAAVRQSRSAFRFASEELRHDETIAKIAGTNEEGYSSVLEYASEHIRANRELVLETVKSRGMSSNLQHLRCKQMMRLSGLPSRMTRAQYGMPRPAFVTGMTSLR